MLEKTQANRQIHVALTFVLATLGLLASTLPAAGQEPPRNPPIVKRMAEPAADVTGHVFLELPEDPHGILVVLTKKYSPDVQFTVTDANGRYRFSNVSPGSYTLHAEPLRSPYLAAKRKLEISGSEPVIVRPTTLLTGDVNDDGIVDELDAEAIENGWHTSCPPYYPHVDLNGDREVDVLDLSLVAARQGLEEPLAW